GSAAAGRLLPPPPPPPSPGLRRSFFLISAVAQRRLGPTSSATISMIDRFSPWSVSHERCSRRPVTRIRAPFWIDSPTFSPMSPQQTTLKNDVASSHSWVWRFCHRRLTARPKLAFAWPLAVNRSSGSRVTFPTTVTLLPVAISMLRSLPRPPPAPLPWTPQPRRRQEDGSPCGGALHPRERGTGRARTSPTARPRREGPRSSPPTCA